MPSKKHSLSPETIEKARTQLASLPPAAPASHNIRQAVKLLVPEIAALRDKGYTLAQIADHLNSAGIPVAQSTLRNYTHQPRRKRGKYDRPDVRKAPAPRTPKTSVAAPQYQSPNSSATVSAKNSSLDKGAAKRGRFTPKSESQEFVIKDL